MISVQLNGEDFAFPEELKGLSEVLSKISKDQKIPADTQFKTGAICLKMYVT